MAAAARLKVSVVGCGGGGSNTVHRCVDEGVSGAELCAINTDVAHLLTIRAHRKILLGRRATGGRGAGARSEVGLRAAEESEDQIREALEGVQIAFVTAGLGGGTGTGSAPVVARLAKEAGALTMGVVSLPFSGEGILRREVAVEGLERLRRVCDTTLVIENDRLLELAPNASVRDAFRLADQTLTSAIKGITETLTKPSLVNLDFADMRTIMHDRGVALIGLGTSDAPVDRVEEAVRQALSSPLLGPVDITHVNGALVHVMGDSTLTVSEAERAVALVTAKVAKDARILWGCSVEESRSPRGAGVRVMLVLTGVRGVGLLSHQPAIELPRTPVPLSSARAALSAPQPIAGHAPDAPLPSPFAYKVRSGFFPSAWRAVRRGFGPRRNDDKR